MANNPRLPFPRISSPEPAGSDANSSVQVQLDAHSHRGPSSRPSPLRAFEQQHTGRPVATLSQSSNAVYLSPESSSQNATAGPPAAAEDILVDLITTPTEPSGGAQHFNTALEKLVAAGQKRPREGDDDDKDDEFLGEPLAKRDKLGEELEQLGQIIASSSSHSGIDLPPSPIQLSGSLLSVTSVTAHGESGHGLKGDMQAISDGSNTLFIGTRQTVPIRAATRRLPIRHLEAKRDPNPPAEAEDGDGHDEKSEAEDASNSDEDEARRGRR